MKRIIFPVLTLILVQWSPAVAQRPQRVQDLRGAIAAGTPFRVRLNPGENNGTIVGGAIYEGRYDPRRQTFSVTGPGNSGNGIINVIEATYRSGDPLAGEINIFGAGYQFDNEGNLFLINSGALAGTIALIRP